MKSMTKFLFAALTSTLMAGSVFAATAAPKAEKPDLAKGEAILAGACAACHMADGNSTTPVNPKLAQQHPEYTIKQLHALAAEHNTAIASMQSRFADFAAKLEEKRRAQQSHLESVLRREIAQYDEVKGQIGSATEAATAERTRLMTELNAMLAAHEAAAARHAADVEAVQSEHEAALDDIERATEARQLQLIHEYDETLVRALPP